MGEIVSLTTAPGSQIVWYRGFEVRLGNGEVEFFMREADHGSNRPLRTQRRRVLKARGKPIDVEEHVRKRVNAYWFEFQHRVVKERCAPMDGLPWEIHEIHNHVARDAATHAYLYDHTVQVQSHAVMGFNVIDWAPFDQRVPVGTIATISFPTGTIREPHYSR